jgi:hypothetical protein
MDLRVEGKTCKTGRTHHNNTKMTTPVSAPPYVSLTKNPSNDLECQHDHSITIDPNETLSSESTLDKIDNCPYHFHPIDKTSNQFSIIRQKKSAKTKSNRITTDTSPVRQLTRAKFDNRIQSSKGKI